MSDANPPAMTDPRATGAAPPPAPPPAAPPTAAPAPDGAPALADAARRDADPARSGPETPARSAARHPLSAYPVDVDAGDLYRHATPEVMRKWATVATTLETLAADAHLSVPDLLARQIQDLGLSFRFTGETEERPWPLTPMPLIVGAEEWAEVERGLIQRATLLEAVAADIYGPQRLVADADLPAAVITGSRFFARNMVGNAPEHGRMIHVYAVDLARGPKGQWRVLADRLRLANGIGYALENRLALSRATGPLLGDIQTRRLADFFAQMREGIAADCARDQPRIALLTPGRFNQCYPEQAHLARYLGFPLVEGRDLVVSEDRLFVRTIAGQKRIDAIWRWIDSNALDPLNFDARSALGVPDLFNAWSNGGLAMANWPGVEVLESPALAAFLPRICRVLLGEPPILPNIATWWCGQKREAEEVFDRLDELVITAAFGQGAECLPGAGPVAPAALAAKDRAALVAAMHRRPMDYCGQEIVHLSTTPALVEDGFAPRAFTVRAFLARRADGGWAVMPGGFARLSASGEMLTSLMGEGEISADLCIVETDAQTPVPPIRVATTPAVRRQGGILASQAADNLFWFGRYAERAEMTTRLLRTLLGSSMADTYNANPDVQRRLVALLAQGGALTPAAAAGAIPAVCHAVLTGRDAPDSIPRLLAMVRDVAMLLRDRFAPDVWRIVSLPTPDVDGSRPAALLDAAHQLVKRFSAISGLAAENMLRGPAWHFLEMGRRLERALATCRLIRALAGPALTADADAPPSDQPGPELLGAMLDVCDSQITYHSRYLTGAAPAPVLDLLLLDPANPRALIFQVEALAGHIAALPQLSADQPPEPPLRLARAALAPLLGSTVAEWDDARLAETETRLFALAEAISARYFLQIERDPAIAQASFLA